MEKGPDAFRTISEVAEDLGLPQHVLRFWETRFPQIKPIKRGGGRRYYRPNDVDLLRGVKHLLYGEGYTIRGVQRILREQGHRKVAAYADGGAPAPDPRDAETGEAASAPTPHLMSAPSGPELWAPQRRPGPAQPAAGASSNADENAPLDDDDVDRVQTAAPTSWSGLSDGQTRRLRTALHELDACRRLLDKRRQ